MTFRDELIHRLKLRDQRETKFHDIIATNNRLLQQNIELEKRARGLESNQRDESNVSNAGTSQRVVELDRRIRELNEERGEMYKTQSENAQRLVNLNEQLRTREEKDKKQTEELAHLSSSVTKLTAKCDLQVQQLREKDVTIQILQDELAALQLEIVTTEEKSKRLIKENAQLLERWMSKMNEEAEKMNEATQFYEKALEQARDAADKQKKSSKKKDSTDISTSIPYSSIVLPKKVFKKINMHDAEIHCISASSCGSMFATGGADKKIKLLDAKNGNLIQTLSGALQTITSVSFNSTDEMVLGSCTDNATRIWSLATHRLKHTLTGHIGKVYAAKFTADSNRVISGSHDRTLKVWDLQKGYNIRTIFTFSSCNDVCLMDADGQTLISGHLDNNIRLWDARTGAAIQELTGVHNGQITSVSMSPDGISLLTNSRDNTLKIIDVRMYDILKSFQADTYRNGLNWSRSTFSPDGKYVAAGSADGGVHIWNVKSGKLERELSEHGSVVCGVSWNPNGEYLYSAEKNKGVCMWETSFKERK